jgi:hypothetical protein
MQGLSYYRKTMRITFKNIHYAIVIALCLMGSLVMAAPAIPAVKFKLKAGAQGKICLTCHESFQKTLKSRAVHSPIKTGKCSDCHDPHTSSQNAPGLGYHPALQQLS